MREARGGRSEQEAAASRDVAADGSTSQASAVAEDGAEALAARRRRETGWPNQRTLLLYLLGGLLVAAIPVVVSRLVDQPDPVTYTIDIPPGTADRLAAGEDVEIFPADLNFKLRDVLIIVNRDSVAHDIGPYEVDPGERFERTFGDVAVISGYCSLHSSGSIRISINDG